MSVDRHLVHQGHVHRFVVTSVSNGWEVREEEDQAVMTSSHRHDWHRVEADICLFEMRARGLKRAGWIEN